MIRVALVGTGYIGGSLLLALGRAGLVRGSVGYDVDPEVARRAQARGVVAEVAATAAEAAAGADVVVLATPVGAIAGAAAEVAGALAPDALVFDLGSTKADVVAAVEAALPEPGRFVGAHPIAGREHRGPDAADPELFVDRPCLLTPTARTRPDALERCRALWLAAGARVTVMDPAMHDRVMGLVSHLPHAAAFALGASVEAALAADGELAAAAAGMWGGGFADTTRIAGSSPVMWRDILLANREVVLALVDGLRAELEALAEALRAGDGEAVMRLVARAGRGRALVMKERA